MKRLTFDELIEQHRVLVGSAEELRDHVEYLSLAALFNIELALYFALGGLNDSQARVSMRRFMEQVAPKVA